tara:strand:- start:362 stop:937 length:576 start_codon:yes stop_codon:yes gene_type:complete
MKKPSEKSEEDLLSDLEQNLQDNLYSKSNVEEEYLPPNLSPEEFQKLWNKKKLDSKEEESTESIDTPSDKTKTNESISDCEQSSEMLTQKTELNLLIKALDDSFLEIQTEKKERSQAQIRRGVAKNSKVPIVRVIRIPLTKDMEDQLITIRRLLNELHQLNNPREVIDDHEVLQALLNWASKQLDEDLPTT